MICKICGYRTNLIYSVVLKDVQFGRCCEYFECQHCGFCFTPSFDNLTSTEWAAFYKYPDYLDQDRWGMLEWKGIGPGRTEILINSLEYGELLIGRIPNKILIHGNGLSKALENLNSLEKYNGRVYATFSYTGHKNEINDMNFVNRNEYDLIIAAEVFEHFSDPVKEFGLLQTFLTVGGCMVGTTGSVEKFKEQYPEDPYRYLIAQPRNGHLCFYSKSAIEIISEKLNLLNCSQFTSVADFDLKKWRIAYRSW